jgi:hypothetical protein
MSTTTIWVRLTMACAMGTVVCAVAALALLAWPTHPRSWMATLTAGAEVLAALTLLLGVVAGSRRRPPPTV